jgi:polar amino acid transport system substrate-binding protein
MRYSEALGPIEAREERLPTRRQMVTALTALAAGLGTSLSRGSPALAGAVLERLRAARRLVIVMDADFPPFSFRNQAGDMDGFDAAVAKALARQLDLEPAIETPGWEAIVAGGWNGRWDICVGSMRPTVPRGELFDFPAVYYWTQAALVVHKDSPAGTVEALKGKKIAVETLSDFEKYLRRTLTAEAPLSVPIEFLLEAETAIPYDSEALAYDDLAKGDGVVLDGVLGDFLAARERIAGGGPFRIVAERLFRQPFAIAVEKGDPEFSAAVAEAMTALKADGTLKKLSEQWLGADVTQ